jgi:hypothetical protein
MENEINLNTIPEIPHGHGLTFKKGVSDGLLGKNYFIDCFHKTHDHSYERGVEFGKHLKIIIANQVKKSGEQL